jgi:hypothetical protein
MRRAATAVPDQYDAKLGTARGAGSARTWSVRDAGTRSRAAGEPGPRGGYGREPSPEPSFADNPPAADEGLASPTDAKPRVANRDDAEAALAADAAYREASDRPDAASDRPGAVHGEASDRADAGVESDAGARPDGSERPDSSQQADSALHDGGPRPASDPPVSEGSGFSYGAGLAEEFAEPDADDPADEPLPQAVSPADAARMARMNIEVLVVDGRPRYHLADCPHLVGRLTEPLPAAEAVELGFSPCGLCRPVDRLVAQAAHH